MGLLLVAALCAAVYVVLRRHDRRMLRNGVALTAALFFGVLGVVDVVARRFPAVEVLVTGVVVLAPVALLVLAGFLVANGVRMFRREGRSLGNMLSLIAGVGVLVFLVGAVLLLRDGSPVATAVLVLALALAGYVGVVFVVFLVAAIGYGRARFPEQVDAVVVLGAGLAHGEVTPLLRSRLDRGIAVFRRSRAAGHTPVVIPSGGKGDDEPRAEATAMAEYLVANGVPAELVHPEDRSRNTAENLRFSRTVQEETGATGRTLVVTNDYHVMRAAMLARDAGGDAQVVGAPTARYYVPSAFLREFAAVVVLHRWGHAAALLVVVGIWTALLGVALRGA